MSLKKSSSVGQVIRRIHNHEIVHSYALYGGDSFLEDYFLSELYSNYFKESGKKIYFSLDQDSDQKLFQELSTISMFEEKKLIIIREIKKIKSKQGRDDFLKYLKSSSPLIVLVIINPEYDLKNSFLSNIAKYSELLDLRPPFKEKMQDWIYYIVKSRKIKITNSALKKFIQIYGDSISHVINEIEKTALMIEDEEISDKNIDYIEGFERDFQLWHLQDSLGKKELNNSLEIYFSLLENGMSLQRIIVNLVFLYQQMLFKKMDFYKSGHFAGVNKIIASNLPIYNRIYSYKEISQALKELRKIDVLSKSTSICDESLIQPLIVKICKNIYV